MKDSGFSVGAPSSSCSPRRSCSSMCARAFGIDIKSSEERIVVHAKGHNFYYDLHKQWENAANGRKNRKQYKTNIIHTYCVDILDERKFPVKSTHTQRAAAAKRNFSSKSLNDSMFSFFVLFFLLLLCFSAVCYCFIVTGGALYHSIGYVGHAHYTHTAPLIFCSFLMQILWSAEKFEIFSWTCWRSSAFAAFVCFWDILCMRWFLKTR